MTREEWEQLRELSAKASSEVISVTGYSEPFWLALVTVQAMAHTVVSLTAVE